MPDPAEPFETWLLQRVARSVEAGEVSADLLTELHTEIAEARERSSEEQHALAAQELAERFDLSVAQVQELLANVAAQPQVTREWVLRRFVEAWLKEQRAEYASKHHRGDDG